MAVYARPRDEETGGFWDIISPIAGLAAMAIPGGQAFLPYLAAGNMINDASKGNWVGMGVDALGMWNGGKGFNTNFKPDVSAVNPTQGQEALEGAWHRQMGNAAQGTTGQGLSSYTLGGQTGFNPSTNFMQPQTQIFDGAQTLNNNKKRFGSNVWG